jgi:ribosomal protein L11
MRKITLLFIMMLAYTGISMAQTIEDFEPIKMNIFSAGANGALTVMPNPDPSGINTSANVVKMVRGMDGDPWAGWYATIPVPVDVTANKYVHVKVWKPRISPVVFKYEKEGANSGDVFSMNPQTLVGQWEELVFDMGVVTGEYVKIVLIPDFIDPVGLTEDITLYFDDLYVNNDPAVGSAPVQIIDNYEFIPLNYLLGGAEDLSSMMILPNPDPTGVNLSDYVIKFNRDKDGVPWGGFWSGLPEVIDVTTNKFVHVKVWKPRITPLRFKIEGGAAGTIEIASKYPQTKINEWEDIVFDFTEKTGTYPIIAFLPDFEDPMTLTEDITIYFDDIILNNDPNPFTPPSQVINVDMSESGLAEGQQVFLSGALGGIYGTWNEPGTNANNEMLDPDGDKIYSITLALPDGVIAFKFFMGIGWGSGDPAPGGDRTYTVSGSANLTYKWGVDGLIGIPANPLADKVQMYPNPTNTRLQVNTTGEVSRVIISSMLGQIVENIEMTSNNVSINTSSLNNGLYFVTFVGNTGVTYTQKLMKN